MISSSQRPLPGNTQHSQQKNIHAPGGIRTHNLSRRAAQTYALDRAATGTGKDIVTSPKNNKFSSHQQCFHVTLWRSVSGSSCFLHHKAVLLLIWRQSGRVVFVFGLHTLLVPLLCTHHRNFEVRSFNNPPKQPSTPPLDLSPHIVDTQLLSCDDPTRIPQPRVKAELGIYLWRFVSTKSQLLCSLW